MKPRTVWVTSLDNEASSTSLLVGVGQTKASAIRLCEDDLEVVSIDGRTPVWQWHWEEFRIRGNKVLIGTARCDGSFLRYTYKIERTKLR